MAFKSIDDGEKMVLDFNVVFYVVLPPEEN
jgi:hypothetical protein